MLSIAWPRSALLWSYPSGYRLSPVGLSGPALFDRRSKSFSNSGLDLRLRVLDANSLLDLPPVWLKPLVRSETRLGPAKGTPSGSGLASCPPSGVTIARRVWFDHWWLEGRVG